MAIKKLNKKIYVIDDITDENYLKFSRRLTALERQHPLDTVIELELCSGGGMAYAALAYADRILNSSLKIHIKAYGHIESAAVMILAVGYKRYMGRNAWVMVHEDAGETDGNTTDHKVVAKQMLREENTWAEMLAVHTTADAATWRKLHNDTTYLTAQECLDLGLIDEVL